MQSHSIPSLFMPATPLYGGVEAGGTKFVCAVGDDAGRVLRESVIPTTTPEETIVRTADFFRSDPGRGALKAIGIGSFGPVDPDPESETFGYITSTPKNGWAHTDFAGRLEREMRLPVGFDTDTNAAALGERLAGVAVGLDTFMYLTVGTGVGGGGFVAGKRMRGLVHPEMGHLMLPRAADDSFAGACPYHGDCLEGMISGPALHARTGRPAEELPPEHRAWTFTVHYLAAALVNYICILSPQRIILGGGVMHQEHLLPRIRKRVLENLNGYIRSDRILTSIESYLVPPGLGDRSGVVGALALAKEAVSAS